MSGHFCWSIRRRGDAGCFLLSWLDCSASGTVLSVSDYSPAAVSVAAVIAVRWFFLAPVVAFDLSLI